MKKRLRNIPVSFWASDEENVLFTKAKDGASLSLSEWARTRLVQAAESELSGGVPHKERIPQVTFQPEVSPSVEPTPSKAGEHAHKLPRTLSARGIRAKGDDKR